MVIKTMTPQFSLENYKRCLQILVGCVTFFLLAILSRTRNHDTERPAIGLQECDFTTSHSVARIMMSNISRIPQGLTVFELQIEDTFMQERRCVPLKCVDKSSPICIYEPKSRDIYVSKDVVKHGCYERRIVRAVVDILKSDPAYVLLDLGCNIGVFTLTAAQYGHDVVGIDPIRKNLRLLSESVCLSKLRERVTLLWNAVSDRRGSAVFVIPEHNVGGTSVRIVNKNTGNNFDDDHKANAILLDELLALPMFDNRPIFVKMDIEGSEYSAMKGGIKFLSEKDIRYILMEWRFHKNQPWAKNMISLMTNQFFVPYSGNNFNLKLRPEQFRNWPHNVIWKKDKVYFEKQP